MTRVTGIILCIILLFCGLTVFTTLTPNANSQIIPLETNLIQPENRVYSTRDVPLTLYVSSAPRFLLASLNGYNFTINGNTTIENLPNGSYDLTVFVTDKDYNRASAQTIHFAVNSPEPYQPPKVTILSPISQTYNISEIPLNYTVDQQAYWTIFSIDGEKNQTAMSNIVLFYKTGTHTLTVYSSGIEGGPAGYDTVTFNVTVPPRTSGTSDGQYSQAVNLIGQAFIEAVTSEAFLITAVGFLAIAFGLIIFFLFFVTRKGKKENKKSRMVR